MPNNFCYEFKQVFFQLQIFLSIILVLIMIQKKY